MPPLRPSAGFAERSHAQDVLRGRRSSTTLRSAQDARRSPERAHRSEAEGSGCG
ncbi:MAG: hypothetical protein RMK99_11510 [Anaerolineales bacterium]|nr:hypothetical protein [Anaerolineales bacterium]